MAGQDEQGCREKKIFLDFAQVCGLAIRLNSIEKRHVIVQGVRSRRRLDADH